MKVVVYTAPACPYCVLVKNFLKSKNIPFEEIDLSKDEKKRQEIADKSGHMTVPITEIGEKIIVGYDLKKIKEALGIK